MATQYYKGCRLTQTDTTTDVTRRAYGRSYSTVARVWAVTGRLAKPAQAQPFLTSVAACREWVNEQLDRAVQP